MKQAPPLAPATRLVLWWTHTKVGTPTGGSPPPIIYCIHTQHIGPYIFTPLWHLNAPGLVLYVCRATATGAPSATLVDPDKGKWTLLEHMHSMLRPFMGVASFLRAGGVQCSLFSCFFVLLEALAFLWLLLFRPLVETLRTRLLTSSF